MYTILLDAMYPKIYESFAQNRDPDFSNPLRPPDSSQWFGNFFKAWQGFSEATIAAIDSGTAWVVSADITGYYESIRIDLLASDLREAGVADELVRALCRALNRWSPVDGRGLPQGFAASDILGKFYLARLDQSLARIGLHHIRYVDDIRIFCSTRPEAQHALIKLIELTRQRGLLLQSAKTEIKRSDVAREDAEGITPIITGIQQQYKDEMLHMLNIDMPSLADRALEDYLFQEGKDPPVKILENAYDAYFLESSGSFNKTLFRYLLKRLGRARSAHCYPHVLEHLRTQPQETKATLDYISASGLSYAACPLVERFLHSDANVYWYQVLLLLTWAHDELDENHAHILLPYVRAISDEMNRPAPLLRVAWRFIGTFGLPVDVEQLESQYDRVGDDRDRAALIMALERMEVGRRNSLLSRCANDGPLTQLAVSLTKRKRH